MYVAHAYNNCHHHYNILVIIMHWPDNLTWLLYKTQHMAILTMILAMILTMIKAMMSVLWQIYGRHVSPNFIIERYNKASVTNLSPTRREKP